MRKLLRIPILLSLTLLLLVRCANDKDAYFERPGWLEPPIYTVLKNNGHFTNYLKCVDTTLYASILKGAGLYTVFAPNDDAFAAYMSKNGYTSVSDIPSSEIDKIVSYSICSSTVPFDSIGVRGSFKYKSQYYALPYRDAEYNNEWVVDQTMENGWTNGYNNYKFVPSFTNAFFASTTPSLTAADYNVFYPDVPFSGKNIQGGEIVNKDMRAENGIVHEVSTVNMPLDNIAHILNRPENSSFKSLVDTKDVYGDYLFRTYLEVTSPTLLKALQKIMPKENIDRIFIKFYTGLDYSLNLENVLDESDRYTPEKSGYTLILPTNGALTEYMNRRILKYYGDVQSLPVEIIQTFVNAHMTGSLVWPANYAMSLNGNGDYLNGAGSSGLSFSQSSITGATLASNGFVYHSNKAVSSRIFESVYSELFINPAHKWANIGFVNNFNNSLREDLQKCVLNGFISERYTLLTFDDQFLKDDGFSYNSTTNTFTHSVTGVNANNRLTRLLREHIFDGLQNNDVKSEITDFATTGISNEDNWNFTVTSYGDPVRYKNNQMQAAGNIEDNTFVNLTKLDETYLNGTVWKADKPLQYSPRVTGTTDDKKFRDISLWEYLDRSRTQNSNVKLFVDYLQKCIKTLPDDATSTALDGISTEQFYTVLMPNNTAMQSAITAKLLPPIDSVSSAYPVAFAKAAFFINSHILQGRVFVDDNKTYLYPANATALNRALIPVMAKVNSEKLGLTNQSLLVEVSKTTAGLLNWIPQNVTQGTKVLVTGATSGTMRVQRGKPTGTTILNNYRSNRIACKAVLHEVNNYVSFKLN
ncbi:MAG: fasciclin domain-containing protein [Paludibacter sp.]